MATANPITDTRTSSAPQTASVLVSIAAMAPEQLETVFASLTAFFPADDLIIITPNESTGTGYANLRIIPTQATNAVWPLAAADFSNAYRVAKEHDARAILMLGPGSDSLSPSALRDLANGVLSSHLDLAVPDYTLPPHTGLVNSAILYPLTRALFASPVRFPLAIDLGLSPKMAERLSTASQRFATTDQNAAILWPTNEALVAGLSIDEVNVGTRMLPQPAEPNINAILT